MMVYKAKEDDRFSLTLAALSLVGKLLVAAP